MANFNPKIRETGNRAANNTGLSSGVTVTDGDLYVNAVSGHLSVEANGVQVPIASDVVVTTTSDAPANATGTNAQAPLHRLAIITDGIQAEAGDGLVRFVNGKSPSTTGTVTLTYTDVGAAATTHTHAMSQITDWQDYFTRIGRSGTGTLSCTASNWTINAATDSNGYDISTMYQDVVISGLNVGLSTSSTLFVDANTSSVTNATAYQKIINDWQFVYRSEYQASNKVRIYSTKIPINTVPIKVTVLSYF